MILFALVALVSVISVNDAFADHSENIIRTVEESGFSQSCVESGCYTPVAAKVSVGSVVTMINTDTTAVHTFTSGTVDGYPSPDGVFDSGVLMSGDSFTWTAETEGEVPYYCMLHTWMQGTIVVGAHAAEVEPEVEPEPESNFNLQVAGSSYQSGDTILVFGYVDDSSIGGEILIFITNPSGQMVSIDQVSVVGKKFSTSFNTDGLYWTETGYYTVAAIASDTLTGAKVFYFTSQQIEPTEPESNFNLQVAGSSYQSGDTILVFGYVDDSSIGVPVTMTITNPSGQTVSIDQVSVVGKTFSTSFNTDGPVWTETGYYTVQAGYGSLMEKEEFYFTSQQIEPTPEPTTDSLPYKIEIVAAQGSGSLGCETTDRCYLPSTANVANGAIVTMTNNDPYSVHTFTSGDFANGPSGVFDSGVLMSGDSFTWIPEQEGQYDYWCMIHPWMAGEIIVGEGTYIPPTQDDLDLQIVMGNSVYDLLDTATMNLYIDENTKQNVALEISDPSGTSIISRSFMVDSQGAPFEFRIDENFKTGTYKVVATTSNDGNTVTDVAYFKVKSQYNSFKITSVQVTDQQGNSSNLEKGEMGFIKVNLEATKAITTLVTVNLFDSDLTSIGIGSIKTTLSSGNSEIILSFMIPSDVAVGTSDIYVNAFSDWPSNGGIPLTSEISIMENIE